MRNGLFEALFGCDGGGQPPGDGFLAGELTAGQDEFLGPCPADEFGGSLSAAPAGYRAEARLGQGNAGFGGDDAEVAGQREFQAAAEPEAVDDGDSGLAQAGQGIEGPVARGDPVPPHPGRGEAGEVVDVRADAEDLLTRGSYDDHPRRRSGNLAGRGGKVIE